MDSQSVALRAAAQVRRVLACMAVCFWVCGARTSASASGPFIRGDVNSDAVVDVSDPVNLLGRLFVPGSEPLECGDVGDTNDDGVFDISDAVYLLASLFVPGSPPPPEPFPDPGFDATPTDPFTCGDTPPLPTGESWIFIADQSGALTYAAIDEDTGALIAPATMSIVGGQRPKDVAITPNGQYVYVADLDAGVHLLSFEPDTGILETLPGSPLATGGFGTRLIAMHPSGNFLFVGRTTELRAYGIESDGSLTEIGTPQPTSSFVSGLTVDGNGQFVYMATNSDEVFAFEIDASSGALTPVAGSPFSDVDPAGAPQGLALTGDGHCYSMTAPASAGPGSVSAWEVGVGGELTALGIGPWPSGGEAATQSASSPCVTNDDFVIVGHSSSWIVTVFTRDAATQELAMAPGSPLTIGGTPHRFALDVDNDRLYATVTDSDSVEAWAIEPDGSLSPIAGSPFVIGGIVRGVALYRP